MFPLLLPILSFIGEVFGIGALIASFEDEPKKAKRIAILGCKGAGKTTLWAALRGDSVDNIRPTAGSVVIESFELTRSNGSKVTIEKTEDIAGGDGSVSDYSGLISSGTCVLFLVSALDLQDQEKMMANRGRLAKVRNEMNIKDGRICYILRCSCYILITNKRRAKEMGMEDNEIMDAAKRCFSNYQDFKVVGPFELTDAGVVEKIKAYITD